MSTRSGGKVQMAVTATCRKRIATGRLILRPNPKTEKKVDRKTRKFRPLTDEVIRHHLTGDLTVGIYPLLLDETCWFLAADFDKKIWQLTMPPLSLRRAGTMAVPAALERSRSGNGGHVWIFFDRAIPAATARKLGCSILTRTMEQRHQIGLDSYDRFFPNQDTLPKGGLGNLIALPLQKGRREGGKAYSWTGIASHIRTSGASFRAFSECVPKPPRSWFKKPCGRERRHRRQNQSGRRGSRGPLDAATFQEAAGAARDGAASGEQSRLFVRIFFISRRRTCRRLC